MYYGLARLDGKMCGVIQLPTRVFGGMEDEQAARLQPARVLILIPN